MNTIDLLISFALSLIMFGIGASLRFADFKSMFKETRPLLTGLSLQMLFLPLFAFAIAYFSPLPPEWKVGLFVIAICPGGTTSNFISYIVNADVALSIALTTVNSVLILFTIPTLSNLAINTFLDTGTTYDITIFSTFLQVLFILLIPAILGILFNEYFSKTAQQLQKPLKYVNTLLLALVFGIKFFADQQSGGSGLSQAEIFHLLPSCLILHLGAIIISYALSKGLHFKNIQATTIGIEVGLQNTTLALLVTGTLIGNNEMTKPALVFAIFSFFTTLAFAFIATRKKRINA